jgi:hypothetical protein
MKFVIFDNHSSDPLVAHVIRSFERRGMFDEVRMCPENDPKRVQKIFDEYKDRLGPFFYFVENDVLVPENICWATVYEEVFRSHPNVGMVGSLCEVDDFTDIEVIRRENPQLSEKDAAYYSYGGFLSVERNAELDPTRDATVGDFPNPPGRLLLLATEAVAKVGFQTDSAMAHAMGPAGFNWYITPRFKHRHLSLMSYFDYPSGGYSMPFDYATARHKFFTAQGGNAVQRFYKRIKRRLSMWF